MVVTTVSRTEKTTPEITKRTDEHGNIVITVGDVNDDGKVSALDAAIIARKLAEGRSSDLNKWAADYNGDGKVTALDCAEKAVYRNIPDDEYIHQRCRSGSRCAD